MPITLDPSLPEPLYPLAWLIGSWQGSGALHRPGDPDAGERRVQQHLVCTAREDGTMGWRSTIHEIDAPAPLPPTSAFARADAPPAAGTGERTLLMREDGIWTVGDVLPGQDVAAARAAKPGDPASFLSYGLRARFERRDRAGEHAAGEDSPRDDPAGPEWAGEVRGPRIQLALGEPAADGSPEVTATRMFGYVGGNLMWLWEQRVPGAASETGETDMTPYISVELHRA
ncbi:MULTISPECIES: heme-binding beta-barrel domain-containing protein [unclassified Brachybacterium]|uniref:heme-binding beta-barrel domain-containing protein n=1 Tax=unclassified Brachybacterium TaxID=2623841 RepID=UPI0036200150